MKGEVEEGRRLVRRKGGDLWQLWILLAYEGPLLPPDPPPGDHAAHRVRVGAEGEGVHLPLVLHRAGRLEVGGGVGRHGAARPQQQHARRPGHLLG